MTEEQMDRIDALVAEKVFGLNVLGKHTCYCCEGAWDVDDDGAWVGSGHDSVKYVCVPTGIQPDPREVEHDTRAYGYLSYQVSVVPSYTRDPVAMMEVIEKMRTTNVLYSIAPSGDESEPWCCKVWCDGNRQFVYAATMPLAVALASLRAVGCEVPK